MIFLNKKGLKWMILKEEINFGCKGKSFISEHSKHYIQEKKP